MKQLTIIIFFMGFFSFLSFGQSSNTQNTNITSNSDSYRRISQPLLDELYKLSLNGIDLIKDSYIEQGTFFPIGFTISIKNEFKMIVYEEPNENKMLTDYVYQKISKLIDEDFLSDSIRIACIVYNGILKNDEFPDGQDCISLHYKSKDFDHDFLISYPAKIENGQILYGDTSLQMINK